MRFSCEGKNPSELCDPYAAALQGKQYPDLREAHLADHRRLFSRVAIDLTRRLSIDGSHIARGLYGVDGWTAHHNTDIWCQAGPVAGSARWSIFQTGGAWLCQYVWEYYAYSRDETDLRVELEKALPRLPPMRISPTTGELQECLEDWQRMAECQELSS